MISRYDPLMLMYVCNGGGDGGVPSMLTYDGGGVDAGGVDGRLLTTVGDVGGATISKTFTYVGGSASTQASAASKSTDSSSSIFPKSV